jgi:hypothetical protein
VGSFLSARETRGGLERRGIGFWSCIRIVNIKVGRIGTLSIRKSEMVTRSEMRDDGGKGEFLVIAIVRFTIRRLRLCIKSGKSGV